MIAENGNILAKSERFKNGMITADIDLYRLKNERRRMTTCQPEVRRLRTYALHGLHLK